MSHHSGYQVSAETKVMQTYYGIDSVPKGLSRVVSVGKFDGVHVGHQQIVGSVIEEARKLSVNSCVVTFDPHPSLVLSKNTPVRILTPLPQKLRLLERMGMDVVVVLPFTREFASISAESFIKDILVDVLHVKVIHEGRSFHFGKAGTAGCEQLVEMGVQYGFAVRIHEPVHCGDYAVSSSRIRWLLENKNFALANLMLARPQSENSLEFQPS